MTVREECHAHVYFDVSSRSTIEDVQDGLRQAFQDRIRVSTLTRETSGTSSPTYV